MPRTATWTIAVVGFVVSTLDGSASAGTSELCDAGQTALENGDDPTAFVALEQCLDGNPAAETRVRSKRSLRAVSKRLRNGRYAEVSLAIEPKDAVVTVSRIAVPVSAQQTVYLPLGNHTFNVARADYVEQQITLTLDAVARSTLVLRLEKQVKSRPAANSVDFESDPPPALPASRPQTPTQFASLIPEKYADGKPRADGAHASHPPRWPWAIVAVGLAVGIGGAVAHVNEREQLALGLYLGAAALVGGGVVTVAIVRPKRAIQPDPELELGESQKTQLTVGYYVRF